MEMHLLESDPRQQLLLWLGEAEAKAEMKYPNAATLCTVSQDGQPDGRIILLKGLGPEGLDFFTNYDSKKGSDLKSSPKASLCLYWDRLGRQVRIQGSVSPLTRDLSERYFHSRPLESQWGAWASPQSQAIPSRKHLLEKFEEVSKKYPGNDPVPLPEHWGGFRLTANRYEFWQESDHRLHDRFTYLQKGAAWEVSRLAP
jgi:pyridoxamine 5'-phosphate oxidase